MTIKWLAVVCVLFGIGTVAHAQRSPFAANCTMSIDGANIQPLLRPNGPGHAPTPQVVLPTPTPGAGPTGQDVLSGGGAAGASEPPPGWQPSTALLVVPIGVDDRTWRCPTGTQYDTCFSSRQDEVNWLNGVLQSLNGRLRLEVNAVLEVQHVSFWDAPRGSSPPTRSTVVNWWQTTGAALPHGGFFLLLGGPEADNAALSLNPCGTYAWVGSTNRRAAPYVNLDQRWMHTLLHEVTHLLGSPHADCYNPPVNTCSSGCAPQMGSYPDCSTLGFTGVSVMSYCECSFAPVLYTPRVAQLVRYKLESAPCVTAQSGTWCTGSDGDGDFTPGMCEVCPATANFWQMDWDLNGIGDLCDRCPSSTADCSPCIAANPQYSLCSQCPSAAANCVGDCNDDRAVSINEVITLVNVALGTASISQCRKGDVNCNGIITVDEILSAVNRALSGCAGGGGGGGAGFGGTVTLGIGSASGAAGSTVAIPVTMAGSSGLVAGAQLDILFPTTLLSNPTCTIDSRLTSQSLAISTPVSPPPPSGQSRLRLIVGDFSHATTFGDGQLLSCTFTINSGAASGTYTLTGTLQYTSDASGNALNSAVTNGAVTVPPHC